MSKKVYSQSCNSAWLCLPYAARGYKSLRMAVKYCQTVIYICDDHEDDGDDDDDDDECSLFQQCVDTRFTHS